MIIPFKGRDVVISGCNFTDIPAVYISRATREGVTMQVAQAPLTWCSARIGDKVIGFAAMMPTSKGGVRLRSRWVHPDYRGHGIGGALNYYRIKAAGEAGYASIDSFARKASDSPKWYLEHGFKQVGETKVAIHVRRAL